MTDPAAPEPSTSVLSSPGASSPAASSPAASTRTLVPGAVVGLLVLAGVGAAMRGPLDRVPVPHPTYPRPTGGNVQTLETPPTMTPTVEPTWLDESITIELPSWLPTALWILLGAVIVVVVLLVVRRLLEMRDGSGPRGPRADVSGQVALAGEAPDLAEPIAQAWQRLRSTAPPRDAVVAAWVALEEGAAAHGAGRAASETPTEFTRYVLSTTRVDPDAVASLRACYLAARFAPDPVHPEDVERAAAALARIEATWSG